MGSDSDEPTSKPKGFGLQRSTSKMNLRGNLASLGAASAGKGGANGGQPSGFGLKRSTSKPSLLDLGRTATQPRSSPSEQSQTEQARPSGGLRRSPSQAQFHPGTSAASAVDEDKDSVLDTDDTNPAAGGWQGADLVRSPSAKPDTSEQGSSASFTALPRLRRSNSMNNFESLKSPVVSEGQKAVESITGTVVLPGVQREPPTGKPARAMVNEKESHDLTQEEQSSSSTAEPGTGSSDLTNFASTKPTQPVASGVPRASTTPTHDSSSSSPPPASAYPPMSQNTGEISPRDDAAARPEAEQRVDYFTHNWNEQDIAGSWRYVISRRQDMANSARLENASWRMWAKAKNNLRTVDPSTVNWLKDYDVTWLYGPLYHEPALGASSASLSQMNSQQAPSRQSANSPSPRGSVASGGSGKHEEVHPKSILKKKTLAQLMLEEAQELQTNSPSARTTTNYLRHHHYRPTPQGTSREIVANMLNRQYHQSASSSNSSSRGTTHQQHSGGDASTSTPGSSRLDSAASSAASSRAASPVGGRPGSASPRTFWGDATSSTSDRRPLSLRSFRSGSYASSSGERHVHFNDRVEQCMAVDPEVDADATGRPPQAPREAAASALSGSTTSPGAPATSAAASADGIAQSPGLRFSNSSTSALSTDEEDDEGESEDDEEDDDDDEDDGDDSAGLFLGLRRPSMFDGNHQHTNIITALPATTLKYDGNDEAEEHRKDPVTVLLSSSSSSSRRPGFNAQYAPHPVQTYEIVDPDIQPVEFSAKYGLNESSEQLHDKKPKKTLSKVQPAASFG